VGLRWEGLDTRTVGNVISEVRNRSDVISPVLQTLWKLPDTKNDQVRFSLSRTYKPPTTIELTPRRYIANNNTATTPDKQGNPDLRPELAWGIDVAYEHYLADSGLLSASAFVRRIQDVILQQLNYVDGRWISSPANDGSASVQGIAIESS
jgi:outer membrane receptor for ferrienterochelin and colicins